MEVSREELDGLPDAYIERLETVEVDGAVRYRVGLDYPELHPFLDAAHDGERRRELFHKNHNKAADTNIEILEEALGVRSSMATLLGFESWAAYALEIKMANQADAVLEFLEDLEERLQAKLAADLTRLSAQQERRTGIGGPIGIADWRYYTNQVIQEDFQVDPFEVAGYFPLDAVLDGMFRIYEELVGVEFVRRPDVADSAWHEDAQPFDIVDPVSGEALARFYMDLYPRPGKFGHAAAFTLRGGRRTERRRWISAADLGDRGQLHQTDGIIAFVAATYRGSDPVPRVRSHFAPDADQLAIHAIQRDTG